ncbi:Uncharacterized conserved protein [Natronorubrum sediminis]|uniref:Uncharacterized conserved protein n=1 Tax=Natronorubrum sediminis TaxID=640943 RepID=A0A1H6G247_9EURY|nr:DUF411 domain-containing protein [Natronorubrum sediminis]SEH15975.1 Uncharacterized conserved protein [Natronorubrum sediminis]
MELTRRKLCASGSALAAVGLAGCFDLGGSSDIDDWEWSGSLPVDSVVQHHDPNCGCCAEYVEYLEDNGFEVQLEETEDPGAVKQELGVPSDAESCHTVEFGDYVVEGHVPLEAVEEAYEDDDDDIEGIAAPGMPEYSPGMGPRGDDPLTIHAFDDSGDVYEYTEV